MYVFILKERLHDKTVYRPGNIISKQLHGRELLSSLPTPFQCSLPQIPLQLTYLMLQPYYSRTKSVDPVLCFVVQHHGKQVSSETMSYVTAERSEEYWFDSCFQIVVNTNHDSQLDTSMDMHWKENLRPMFPLNLHHKPISRNCHIIHIQRCTTTGGTKSQKCHNSLCTQSKFLLGSLT
jgi:hypothetical protein